MKIVCFACKEPGYLIQCGGPSCDKAYHEDCLSLCAWGQDHSSLGMSSTMTNTAECVEDHQPDMGRVGGMCDHCRHAAARVRLAEVLER